MDRSYLSKPAVITAAEQFVCIRLTTYENEAEADFMRKLIRGPVANTVFAVLTPDGTQALRGRGPSRGPKDLFEDAAAMAIGLDAVAAKYQPKPVSGVPPLPVTLNLKVALAVAAGDLQPLVVVLAKDPEQQLAIENKVAQLAWAKSCKGRFTYVSTASLADQPKINGCTISEGVVLIDPDMFGAGGKVVEEVTTAQIATKLAAAMMSTAKAHVRATKTRRLLAILGLEQGIYYETYVPVSGKGEASDRERYKAQLDAQHPPEHAPAPAPKNGK